jgi:hypothetical protein
MNANMHSTHERNIATFVTPSDYARNANQIAAVTTHRLLFVERRSPGHKLFELVEFSLADCSAIFYESELALLRMVLGGLLVALMITIGVLLEIHRDDLQLATRIPVGAMVLALVAGLTLLRDPWRHHLTFEVHGRKLEWHSKTGRYQSAVLYVQRVIAFAKKRGLLAEG